ncbi:MAG: DUF1343 domain-containing protein [Puniceicoccales bacterium]|nr:DUF1343 domain-containing protein [Puniceicoccales bacterium]
MRFFFFIPFCISNLQALELGIDVLQSRNFSDLKDKKVALLTNPSALDSKGKLTLDIFLENKVCQLKVILFPEHNGGFDDQKLEELKKKNISVYSTHTPTSRSPELEWFKDIDIVVSDMQEIGMRYYTYSTSMLYAMIKAFEANKDFLILDRPNPLGDYIGGPVMDKKYLNFLGPIAGEPVFHGMTIAEKANYVKNCGEDFEVKCTCGMEGCMHGVYCNGNSLKKGKLIVVKMKGWDRKKILTQFNSYANDNSISLSPHIQNIASIFDYAIISLSTLMNEGFIRFLKAVELPQMPERWFKYISVKVPLSEMLAEIEKDHFSALEGCTLKNIQYDNQNYLELLVNNFANTTPALISLLIMAQAQKWIAECDWDSFEKATPLAEKTPPSEKTDSKKMADLSDASKDNNVSVPERNPEKLTQDQQKILRKAKWDRLTRLQRDLVQKHTGDEEFINKLLEGELIDVNYFRDKWNQSAIDFRNKTKQYYLY